MTKRKRRAPLSKIIGETIHRTIMVEGEVVEGRIDSSNGTIIRVILRANNRCKEAEQQVLMYSLVAKDNVEQKVRKVAVKKKMSSLRMMEVCIIFPLTGKIYIDYDGMRRMEDLQSEFDTRSEISGSSSRD